MERVWITWRGPEVNVPALRDGNVVAWNYELPWLQDEFDHPVNSVGRSFLLIEPGIKLTIPPVWIARGDPCWYVDLVIVEAKGDRFDVIDFDIDVIVPEDDRPFRILDVDELGDAIEAGEFTTSQVIDGLRRFQHFLDTYLQRFGPLDVDHGWRDFPPQQIATLRALPDSAFAWSDEPANIPT